MTASTTTELAEWARFAFTVALFPAIYVIDYLDERKFRIWEARYNQHRIDLAEGE